MLLAIMIFTGIGLVLLFTFALCLAAHRPPPAPPDEATFHNPSIKP